MHTMFVSNVMEFYHEFIWILVAVTKSSTGQTPFGKRKIFKDKHGTIAY